jgi:hypothetical protein
MATVARRGEQDVSFFGWGLEGDRQGEWVRCLQDVLGSGEWLSHGSASVARFEDAFARWLGRRCAVAVSSGSEALALALEVLDLPRGGEVLTPAFTFQATAAAVVRSGLVPRFIDVRAEDLQIDPAATATAVSSKTVAVLPVHLYGLPAPLDELGTLTRDLGLVLVEDCAQAMGAGTREGLVGTRGTLSCFSCGPTKQLAAPGEGGVVALDDPDLTEGLRALRHNGSSGGFDHRYIGRNGMMGVLEAAFLAYRLQRLDAENEARRQLALRYEALLVEEPSIGVVRPRNWDQAAPSKFTVVLPDGTRDAVRAALGRQGIPTAVYYEVPLHRQRCFSDVATPPLPVTDEAARRVLSLPIHPHLTGPQVERVAASLIRAVRENAGPPPPRRGVPCVFGLSAEPV